MMMDMLMTVLAIISEPSRILGSSSRFTMRFQGLPCLVLSTLMSLNERENSATSEPDMIKDSISRNRISTPKMVLLFRLAAKRYANVVVFVNNAFQSERQVVRPALLKRYKNSIWCAKMVGLVMIR